MYCKSCGKEFPDNSTFCPHCGMAIERVVPAQSPYPPQPQAEESNVWAGLSFLGLLLPPLGWVFGGLGIAKANKLNGKGMGAAVTGLVLSIVNSILGMILFTM